MPKILQYTNEFKDQAVRFVFESIEPTESRKEACRRLASKVNVKEVTPPQPCARQSRFPSAALAFLRPSKWCRLRLSERFATHASFVRCLFGRTVGANRAVMRRHLCAMMALHFWRFITSCLCLMVVRTGKRTRLRVVRTVIALFISQMIELRAQNARTSRTLG